IAFEHFTQVGVEIAVFEVGLGGRLDATNILTPQVSVIARVDFDHESFLGHSLMEIAAEKAGIIKPEVPLVLAKQKPDAREVILTRTKELNVPAIETEKEYRAENVSFEEGCVHAEVVQVKSRTKFRVAPQLRGRFQLENAVNAIAIARVLNERGPR